MLHHGGTCEANEGAADAGKAANLVEEVHVLAEGGVALKDQ